MNKRTFLEYIAESDFRGLFIREMGWNNPSGQTQFDFTVDDCDYSYTLVAERNGFQVLSCEIESVPTSSLCKKIDTKLRRQANDYICIYYKPGSQHHLWVVPVKKVEKRDLVLVEYETANQADFLFEKVDGFSFDLDEKTTIMDVKERVQDAFIVNSEKITKDFYTGFRKEHANFAKFISGIDDEIDVKENRNKQWYTSVMLNRLMFCYFIQKKGFLDFNTNYLRDKLQQIKSNKGDNKFYSFYRRFLISLFHDGLNSPRHESDFEKMYGRIPYLNGGMFDVHELEAKYPDIDIDDKAFESLFAFFDQWHWHLDDRLTASGKDINPDVLGYIFEQYINDRAQMGAYYTKEDITEYIGRNTIVPYLLDETRKKEEASFLPNGNVWKYLQNSGDRYIFDAVKHGHETPLPEYITVGIDTEKPNLLERRSRWNERTPDPWALPTEIWRETIERLQRYEFIRHKIECGEIIDINDFITFNLNIRKFIYEFLQDTKDHLFVKHFYAALKQVSILDPTCGSGAFLFAALNILEPLYEVCIMRMQEWNAKNPHLFEEELHELNVKYRSNIRYFIYKSIILRNLYGVDIMVEATEIAKLRLFLKMVAVVDVNPRDKNLGLDPLPDIDFNIRCGNTLVGYATEKEMNNGVMFEDIFARQEFEEKVNSEIDVVSAAYDTFRKVQLEQDTELETFKIAKSQLKERLDNLNELLNKNMHATMAPGMDYCAWKKSHQPFHWYAEYYDIIHGNGGFDVIIGNPPYVGYTRKNKETKKAVVDIYTIRGYSTLPTSNLYAFTIERSCNIMHSKGQIGMIVPISAFANDSMKELQSLIKSSFANLYISNFHQRPAQLFVGVLQRLSIFIASKDTPNNIFTTGINRWYEDNRKLLFQNLSYAFADQSHQSHMIKIGTEIEARIFSKYVTNTIVSSYLGGGNIRNSIFYRTAGGGYWVTFLNKEFDCVSVSNKHIAFKSEYSAKYFTAALNSNLFWWYYSINYDLFNFKDYMIFGFQISYDSQILEEIVDASDRMENNLRKNASYYVINSKTNGATDTVTYRKQLSKSIMDEIDILLAKHYGFTEEELDFIINYDIKYRMGDELDNNE